MNQNLRARTHVGVIVILFAITWPLATMISRGLASTERESNRNEHWVGTWATAPQPSLSGKPKHFHNQSLRLIVHTSIGGTKVRVKISNTFGDQSLLIGGAHIARRTAKAEIDPTSDRRIMFQGRSYVVIPRGTFTVSDPVDLQVPALSDLAVTLFLPKTAAATTSHLLALQTNFVSPSSGDHTSEVKFPIEQTTTSWPFLTGVDIMAPMQEAAIVAFGASLTDGDGSTEDENRRWPDVLARRLENERDHRGCGVLNEGIIGNRLLSDFRSQHQAGGPFAVVFNHLGPALGSAGLARFDRDVLAQAGVKYVIVGIGINDIIFPGTFIPSSQSVSAQDLTSGYRELIARSHKKGIKVFGTTITPFENATFSDPRIEFYTREKEAVRQEVNSWIRAKSEFDAVVDFDAVVRDPRHPSQLLPSFDSGDHLHVNDLGNIAQGDAIPLSLFGPD